jgi:hypothetical protein
MNVASGRDECPMVQMTDGSVRSATTTTGAFYPLPKARPAGLGRVVKPDGLGYKGSVRLTGLSGGIAEATLVLPDAREAAS